MDDFDRRAGPNHRGDFFSPPRFGPMNNGGGGMRGMMPMGGRNGPQFGPRGGPMFMRGMRPGPPGFQFADRAGGGFFDREGPYDREERRRNGPPERRGESRRGGNRFPRESKSQQQRSSRWGGGSPRGGQPGDEQEDEGPPGVAPETEEAAAAAAAGELEADGGACEEELPEVHEEAAPGQDEDDADGGGDAPGKATPLYDEPAEGGAAEVGAEAENGENAAE
ncbi:serine/threonine-protein phosphatase 1 regulatory subunit 10-like [Phlebotomus argentipes]|uniref:serine/threonine-protein phosphatase 1 regulatory subunit 10-like n=1 Tax=Phlebotomus argentipes TaxID=94469 RepID=UPI0028935A69|nr:serine/threonine-protein phosphatase 1 regulatory subunit 10-like [Phlebotomus argentipes]